MSKKTLKFDYVEVNKKKIHVSKQRIALHLVPPPVGFPLITQKGLKL